MKLISVNVGLPREVDRNGEPVMTGIYKEPVTGRVMARTLNLDGDRQADLTVHGGIHKAVYAYPLEHYEFWRREYPGKELFFGAFGENLTVEGILEETINVGDRLKIGDSIMTVTQPRQPCFKLGIKFGDNGILKRFIDSGRSGFYLSVQQEGEVGAGDAIEIIQKDPNHVSIADMCSLYYSDRLNRELLERAVKLNALPDQIRDYFQRRLDELE